MVFHDDMFDDGKTKTGNTLFPVMGFIHTIESLEDTVLVFLLDFNTII